MIVLMMVVVLVEMEMWASSGESAGPLLLVLLADIDDEARGKGLSQTLPPVDMWSI